MYDTGLGPTEVDRFLADLNISGLSQTSIKQREKEVFCHISKVAEDSLDSSLEEEKKQSPTELGYLITCARL